MNITKHRLTLFTVLTLLLFALILLAAPTLAQDATAEPTPPPTLDTAPVATVMQEDAPPVAVEMSDGSGDLTINNNAGNAADTTDAAAGLPTGWLWWLVLLLMGVVVMLTLIILYLLRDRAKAGNQEAVNILKGIEAARDLIPLDKVQNLLDMLITRATTTANPWDDIIAGGIKRGLDAIVKHETTETVTSTPVAPAGTSPVNVPLPGASIYPDAG